MNAVAGKAAIPGAGRCPASGKRTGIQVAASSTQKCDLHNACRLANFYDSTPAGFLGLTRRGTIRHINRSGAQMLGFMPMRAIGKRIGRFVVKADRLALAALLEATFEKEAHQNGTFHLDPTSHGSRAVGFHAIPSPDKRECLMTMLDYSRRISAEEALASSKHEFSELYEKISDAIVTVTMSGRIVKFNRAYRKMLGYTVKELFERTYSDLTPAKWHASEAAIVAKQVVPRGYSKIYEKEYRRKNGTIFPVELRTEAIKDNRGKIIGMWAIVRDITRRKQEEARLRSFNRLLETRIRERTDKIRNLAIDLSHAEQRERSRISSILHGHLQQLIGGARYLLQTLNPDLSLAGQKVLATVDQVLEEGIHVTRNLSVELSPPIPQHEGLASTLHWLAHRMEETQGIVVKVTTSPVSAPIPEHVSTILYQS